MQNTLGRHSIDDWIPSSELVGNCEYRTSLRVTRRHGLLACIMHMLIDRFIGFSQHQQSRAKDANVYDRSPTAYQQCYRSLI